MEPELLRVLVRKDDTYHRSAHLPDANGHPLCPMNIKLKNWEIKTVALATVTICWHCRRIKAKQG